METPNAAGSRPLEVVVLYVFDSSTSNANYKLVDEVYWVIQDKIGCFASSSRLSYIYFMYSNNTYTFQKRLARSGEAVIQRQRLPCTKNMACGLPEAHRLISQCDGPTNGIILFFSDGLVHKGNFFDGAEDFVSAWPVHTFTVGGDAYNKDDEQPPARHAESHARIGIVTMHKPTYSKNDVALMAADSLTVGVELNAASSATAREGLDLVVVIDIQRSREGGDIKLSKMKKAMEYVVTKLTPMDRLSIVSKGSLVNGLRQCPLRCMTPSGQAHLKAVINSLTKPSVNLQEGLMVALAVIRGRCHTEGRTASILFLTDDRECAGNARSVDPGNVAVHTFGFGNKAGHELLNDIAKRSPGGTYSFVPDDSDLCGPFSQILGGLLTTVAQDVVLTLTSKGKDVDTMEVSPGIHYKHTTNINSRGEKEIAFSFGTIFSGESRKVSVNFSLNPSKNSKGFDATIAEAQHSYTAQQGLERQPPHSIHIRRAKKPTAAPSVDAAALHAEDVRRGHADSIRAAAALADNGELEEARYKLQDGLNAVEDIVLDEYGDKMVGVLRAELLQLSKLMASKELYQELGRPYALAVLISHGLQRATAKGDTDPAVCLYVTPRMVANLKQAKQFDKDPISTPLPSADDDLKAEIAANPLAAVAGPLAFYLDNAIQSLLAIKKILVATI